MTVLLASALARQACAALAASSMRAAMPRRDDGQSLPVGNHLLPCVDDIVSLSGRPPHFIPWEESTHSPEILQAIGQLAIASAEFEDTCHYIYWKYARLNWATGPVITASLSPNRLTEDIIKLARQTERNKRRLEDLGHIFSAYKNVAQERNSCIHWLWAPMIGSNGYVVRPIHKGPGPGKPFTAAQICELAYDMAWLEIRLHIHLLTHKSIKAKRVRLWPAEAEVSAPAPWLDKLPPQDPKRSKRRATRK
jgi:hypothetical protein